MIKNKRLHKVYNLYTSKSLANEVFATKFEELHVELITE